MAYQQILEFGTFDRGSRDISAAVREVVQHTSCSLMITENADPDVRHDLETILRRLAPDNDPAYRHRTEGPDDMAAHARTLLTETSLTIPVGDSRLLLGTWQGIFLWEHRVSAQQRSVVVTVMGE